MICSSVKLDLRIVRLLSTEGPNGAQIMADRPGNDLVTLGGSWVFLLSHVARCQNASVENEWLGILSATVD